jgi:hypothetical protein
MSVVIFIVYYVLNTIVNIYLSKVLLEDMYGIERDSWESTFAVLSFLGIFGTMLLGLRFIYNLIINIFYFVSNRF